MTNIVSQNKRQLELYSTEAIPEGLYIDRNTGETFASYTSLALIVKKPRTTINDFVRKISIDGDGNNTIEKVKALTANGWNIIGLVPERIIKEAIKAYNPELFEKMADCGLRVYLHGLAGFATVSTALTQEATTPLEKALQDTLLATQKLLAAEEARREAENKLAESEKEIQELKIFHLRAIAERPGLKLMLEEFQETNPEQRLLPSGEPEQMTWTLYEWMEEVLHPDAILRGTMFKKLVSKVHGAFKAITHTPPQYEYRPQTNNPKQLKKVQVYTRAHFPILYQCFIQTQLESAK